VYATPAGAELVEGFGQTMSGLDDTILAPLDPAEQDEFLRLLRKVTAELERPHR
jgi:DNA-binding MarR family transcriptional regulator